MEHHGKNLEGKPFIAVLPFQAQTVSTVASLPSLFIGFFFLLNYWIHFL